MAKFALKHLLTRAHLIKLMGKEVNKECQGMCRESVKVAIGDEIPEIPMFYTMLKFASMMVMFTGRPLL